MAQQRASEAKPPNRFGGFVKTLAETAAEFWSFHLLSSQL
jgi:hypothetical protein